MAVQKGVSNYSGGRLEWEYTRYSSGPIHACVKINTQDNGLCVVGRYHVDIHEALFLTTPGNDEITMGLLRGVQINSSGMGNALRPDSETWDQMVNMMTMMASVAMEMCKDLPDEEAEDQKQD